MYRKLGTYILLATLLSARSWETCSCARVRTYREGENGERGREGSAISREKGTPNLERREQRGGEEEESGEQRWRDGEREIFFYRTLNIVVLGNILKLYLCIVDKVVMLA